MTCILSLTAYRRTKFAVLAACLFTAGLLLALTAMVSDAGGTVSCANPTAHAAATIGFNPPSGQPNDPLTVTLDINHGANAFDGQVEAFLGTGRGDIQGVNMIGEGTLPQLSEEATVNGTVPNLPPGGYSVIVCWQVFPLEGGNPTWKWDSAPGFTIPATPSPTATPTPAHTPTPTSTPTPTPDPNADTGSARPSEGVWRGHPRPAGLRSAHEAAFAAQRVDRAHGDHAIGAVLQPPERLRRIFL
jgi:hypothetical protein